MSGSGGKNDKQLAKHFSTSIKRFFWPLDGSRKKQKYLHGLKPLEVRNAGAARLFFSNLYELFVDVCESTQAPVHTGNSGEAGERVSACNLHAGHIGAAGVQSCEAVVAVGGSVCAESVIGAQLSVVQRHGVAAAHSRDVLHPGDQQHGGSPGLELDRETHGVA